MRRLHSNFIALGLVNKKGRSCWLSGKRKEKRKKRIAELPSILEKEMRRHNMNERKRKELLQKILRVSISKAFDRCCGYDPYTHFSLLHTLWITEFDLQGDFRDSHETETVSYLQGDEWNLKLANAWLLPRSTPMLTVLNKFLVFPSGNLNVPQMWIERD